MSGAILTENAKRRICSWMTQNVESDRPDGMQNATLGLKVSLKISVHERAIRPD